MKSYLANDHLEFRGGVFDGIRTARTITAARRAPGITSATSAAPSSTSATREKGYVPVGTNLGKKKIIAIGGGYDTQGSYEGYGGDFMLDIPFGKVDPAKGQNSLTAHIDYIHFDGGCGLNAAGTGHVTNCLLPTLFEQEEIFSDLGFYFVNLHFQPWIKYEWNGYKEKIDSGRNSRRYGVGFNYYVAQQNLKITPMFERIVPNAKGSALWKTKNTDHFVVQFQFYYF